MRSDYVGLRVARWRDIAGMTQQDLADAIDKSREYVSMIENGHRAVTKRSLLISLARALGVAVSDLIGEPMEPVDRSDLAIHNAVAAVRIALDGDGELAPASNPGALDFDADRLIRARLACNYVLIAELLPKVIAASRHALASGRSGHARNVGLSALVRACVYGAYTLKTAGYIDLATRLAERARASADQLGDQVHIAAAHMATAQTAMATGVRRRALDAALAGAEVVAALPDSDARAWHGKLMVQAALSAASLGRHDAAAGYLDIADRAAAEVVGDPWHMDFSTADVAIWRMGVALENGEAERAPVYARQVDVSRVRTPQRLVRYHIDRGRGLFAIDDTAGAVRAFHAAHDVSPPEVRRRGAVLEIVGQMVRDSRGRGGSDELKSLAQKIGIDPFASAATT